MRQNAEGDHLGFMDACSTTQFSSQFRSPITDVLSQFPYLLKHTDEKGYGAARSIETHMYHILRNVRNIEVYSQLAKPYFKFEILDMVALVKCVCDAVNAVCKTKIETSFCEGPILVEGDRALQMHALLGVIRNAFCYTADHNSVQISLMKTENLIVTKVSDKGKGIKPEYYDEIFEPFFSIDPYGDSNEEPGLGLDLAILYRLQQHIGARRPFVTRSLLQGNTIAMSLPILKDTEAISRDKYMSCQSSFLVSDRYSSLYLQLCGFCRFPD